ncbi:MAG: DUF3592 domain-containing protein [Clostridia bacterium]|nr:DUF3592 domain-containing protein [Clostridia bacterium]
MNSVWMKLYIAVPLVLLIVTIVLAASYYNRLKKSEECTGVIVRFIENIPRMQAGPYGNKTISPVVSYSADGKAYEFIGRFYATSMKEGDTVKVLYSKENHAEATIKTGGFIAPIITGGLTVAFMIPVIIYIVMKAKGLLNF